MKTLDEDLIKQLLYERDPNLPINSLKNYLHHLYSYDEEQVEQVLKDIEKMSQSIPTPVEKQRVEETSYPNYQGTGLTCDFEYHIIGHTSEITSIPLYNEYVPKDAAFIDWLSFTFSRNYYPDLAERIRELELLLLTAEERQKPDIEKTITHLQENIIIRLSRELDIILGYGVTRKHDRGYHAYPQAYSLGNDWGVVALGGQSQQGTIWVSITGDGCTAAREDWEHALYDWVKFSDIPRFKITRIDIAHDCYDYSVDKAIVDYDQGRFGIGGRLPTIEQKGDWRTPRNEKGRTVCIGQRGSGRYCRIYEKGKQLGDPNSELVRIECEWHSKSRKVTPDMLISPGSYLAGAYPALMWIHETQDRAETNAQRAKIGYDKTVETLRQQYGPLIWQMYEVEGSIETVLSKLTRPGKPPARVIVPDWVDSSPPLHLTAEDDDCYD